MPSSDSFTFTVGKLDAGMAILLGERAHLIEFPSILLPPGATTGSIVNISVNQNHSEEKRRDAEFWELQDDILNEFGVEAPESPQLQLRNVTQTSVTLEWPPLKLAKAKLRSLDIYRKGQRLASIPSPLTNTSTKLSGLELNSEYSFQLVLRTSAGTYPSNLLRVRTHSMTDTSGICVCFGNVQDPVLLDNAKMALGEMKAKWSDKIQIDTTHFVCTTPAATPSGAQVSGNAGGAPGVEYQRALQLSIPVVQPHWILACHSEKKMVPIASYYLGATPTPTQSAGFNRPQSMSQASLHQSSQSVSSATTTSATTRSPANRASMPPPARSDISPPQSATTPTVRFEPPREEDEITEEQVTPQSGDSRKRSTSMKRNFKFPNSPPIDHIVPEYVTKEGEKNGQSHGQGQGQGQGHVVQESIISPSTIEVPPPPPVEKERSTSTMDDGEDDVGDTVEVPLN